MNQTAEQVIVSIQSLPLPEQWQVLAWLNEHKPAPAEKASQLSETDIARLLLAQGVIKEIPPDWDQPEEDFEPIGERP